MSCYINVTQKKNVMENYKSTQTLSVIDDPQIKKIFKFNDLCLKGIVVFCVIECLLITISIAI